MEFQPSLTLAGRCVNIGGIFVQIDDGSVGDENVSKSVKTAVQVGSAGVEILDGVIENLSKERNERRLKPLMKRGVREFVTVSHLDVAFEKGLERAV